jgi:hypothetical protein
MCRKRESSRLMDKDNILGKEEEEEVGYYYLHQIIISDRKSENVKKAGHNLRRRSINFG